MSFYRTPMAKKRYRTLRSANGVLGVPSLELVLEVLARIPGTHAAAASIAFASGDFERGASIRVDPSGFTDPESFAIELLGASLLRKYPGFPGAQDKASRAIEKWLACEETCRATNERIKQFRIGQVRPDLHEAFRLARKKIEKLLGTFRWAKVAGDFDFGPGSTTRLPYSKRFLPYKFGESPETTFDNLASATAAISLSPVWTQSSGGRLANGSVPCLKIREHSKVTTVPKDAFIDRVIAIEPCMNMYVQKGFGGYIRRRLKLVGIDLNDQTTNQLLAQQGSRGGLATLDLASASDTVSYEIVRELLPPDWFEALLSARTHESQLPSGEIIQLQKFSSMGNGFTFELESLIFWALCSSVCQGHVGRNRLRAAVYGDDIIVEVADFDAVVDILEFSGFTLNPKKTYRDGPYRESCGKHYFYGRDVTPITITKEVSHVDKLLLLCNNLRRAAFRIGGHFSDRRIFDAHSYCVGHLPHHFRRPRLPEGYGDGALIGTFDEVLPRRAKRGWDGYRSTGILVYNERSRRLGGVATLSACLYGLEACYGGIPQRGMRNGSLELAFRRLERDGGAEFSVDDPRRSTVELLHGSKLAERLARLNRGGTDPSVYLRMHSGTPEKGITLWRGYGIDSPEYSLIQFTGKWVLGNVTIPQWDDRIGPWGD